MASSSCSQHSRDKIPIDGSLSFGGRAIDIRQIDYCINILHFLCVCGGVCVCVRERRSHCVTQVCEFSLVLL